MIEKWFAPAILLVTIVVIPGLVPGPSPAQAQTNTPALPALDSRPLAPPAEVKASDCEYGDKIRITWKVVPLATRYQVYRGPFRGDTAIGICDLYVGIGFIAQCDDTTAMSNYPHIYAVRAYTLQKGWTDLSTPDWGIRRGPIPDPPTDVEASDGTYTDYVRVSWTGSMDFDRYRVGRAPSGVWPPTQSWETDMSPYNDDTAICSNQYLYAVKSRDHCGQWSGYSSPDEGYRQADIPPMPSNVQASQCTYPDKIRLTWDAVECAEYYLVDRHTSSSPTTPGEEVYNGSGTGFDDTDVDPGQVYYYWVKACNDAGCTILLGVSDLSGVACPVPLNVEATDCTYADIVRVTWDSVPNAEKYRVYRATPLGGTKTELADVTSPTTSFYDTSATPDTTYHYWVKACFDSTCTAISDFSLPDAGCCGSAPEDVNYTYVPLVLYH